MSIRNRTPLQPQREVGRQRVAELIEAAAEVIQARGLEAATMAEIAARADAKIGSLYRFFPSKEAVAEALMQHYVEVLRTAFESIEAQAAQAAPEELADLLIDFLAKIYPRTRAVTALLDSRADWTKIRQRVRGQAIAGIKRAMRAHLQERRAPDLDEREADAVAAVVLNNMKTMVGMTMKDAPTSPGAPDELRLMNRLYLAAKLGRPAEPKRPPRRRVQ